MEPAQAKRAHPSPKRGATGSKREALSVFAPDAECLLGRPVGNREQHGFFRRPVDVALPWRHDEDVIRTPFEDRVVDLGRTAAFDADEDRAVGRTVGFAFKAFW